MIWEVVYIIVSVLMFTVVSVISYFTKKSIDKVDSHETLINELQKQDLVHGEQLSNEVKLINLKLTHIKERITSVDTKLQSLIKKS